METTITERSPVEYTLEITADTAALDPRIDKALRRLRGTVNMKGFRPGKVPLSLVKKMYGKAVAVEVVEQLVQETYESTILGSGDYVVLGPPTITTLDYEPFGDLKATVEFGTRPKIDWVDLSGEEVVKLTHEVTDEEVDEELERIRATHADLVPHEEGASEEDVVYVDMQRLDDETGVPIIGESEKLEDVPIYLGNPNTVDELKNALTGKTAADVVRVTLPPPEQQPEGVAEPIGARRFEVTVKEVKRRELPELDDEFIEDLTEGRTETLEAYTSELRKRMETEWENALRENFESSLTQRMIKLHPVPVPASAVETYLDAFVADVKRESGGELPEDFDEAGYREENRSSAEDLVRWLVIRDRIAEQEDLTVTPDDLDAEYERMGEARGIPGDTMRQIMQLYNPDGENQVERDVLNRKVYDLLAERFQVVERAWEDDRETDVDAESSDADAESSEVDAESSEVDAESSDADA